MLSLEQMATLERLQAPALRVIFSYEMSYAELHEVSGLDLLKLRRETLLDRFVMKTAKNPRFLREWFPCRTFHHHDLRKELVLEEGKVRTERLYRSPIFFYKRRLNEIYQHEYNLTEGNEYNEDNEVRSE